MNPNECTDIPIRPLFSEMAKLFIQMSDRLAKLEKAHSGDVGESVLTDILNRLNDLEGKALKDETALAERLDEMEVALESYVGADDMYDHVSDVMNDLDMSDYYDVTDHLDIYEAVRVALNNMTFKATVK